MERAQRSGNKLSTPRRRDPEHLGGSPRVRGTRISVALILESLAAGMSVAEIVDAYPSLTEKSVRGVLAELAHQQEPQHA